MSRPDSATWTLLVTASGKVTAHLLSGRLRQEGIDAILDESNPSPGAWLLPFGDPAAPVKILVPTHQLEWAQLILNEAETSSRRDVPAHPARKLSVWWVLVAATVAALIILGGLPDGSSIGF